MKLLYVIILVVVIISVLVAVMLYRRRRQDVTGGGTFRLKVSDPEYTAMLDNKKTVEARLDRPPFDRLKAGDPVVVVRSRPKGDTSEYPGGKYKFDAEVVRVTKYKSLEALLQAETLAKVYPSHKTAADASERFKLYLPPGTSASDAVLAIELRAVKALGVKAHGANPKKLAAERAAGKPQPSYYDEFF